MKEQTVKILVAVLRVFVSAVSKGNAVTLQQTKIVDQVCRDLHKRKEREIKNMRGQIAFALNALRDGKILYEAFDSWADDKLKRSKSTAEKRLFGLTDPALRYIEDHKTVGVSVQGSQFLINMLRVDGFGILPKETSPITIDAAPPALAETVTAIKQEQKELSTPEQNAKPANTENNDQKIGRLVAAVMTETVRWPYANSTPAHLLGGLCEYYLANEGEQGRTASAIKLRWPERRRKVYREAVRFLKSLGLVEDADMRRSPDTGKLRAYGVRLTDLGLEVGGAGKFKDNRPESERLTDSAPTAVEIRQKESPMLKGAKKETKELPVSASTPQNSDVAKLLAEVQNLQRQLLQLQAGNQDEEDVVEQVPPALNVYETISVILAAFVPDVVKSLSSLINEQAGTINADGVYLAFTEMERVIAGLKGFVSERLEEGAPIDLDLLRAYADDFNAAATQIPQKRTWPLLAERILTKRALSGENAIKRKLWRRPQPASR